MIFCLLLGLISSKEAAAGHHQSKHHTVNTGVVETPFKDVSFLPGVYNDHIGIQNVIPKADGLYLRSAVDEGSMIRWDVPNPHKNWSFVFEFNDLNLETRESASIFLFYTTEKPNVGVFRGGPSTFHGFAVGLELTGKNVQLLYTRNDGTDYTDMEDIVTTIDSLNPQRFHDLENLKFKVISTEKNFKVELYDGDKVIYDNFRNIAKDTIEFAKGGHYLSIFADYDHTSSGKAFKLTGAHLYNREETTAYDPTRVNMPSIPLGLRKIDEIRHPNVDIKSMLFKMNAVIAYTKAMLGELPETNLVVAERDLLKEGEVLLDRLTRLKAHIPTISPMNEISRKANDLDVQLKRISKTLSEIEYLIDWRGDGAGGSYMILEYILVFSGMLAVSVMFYREIKKVTSAQPSKMEAASCS